MAWMLDWLFPPRCPFCRRFLPKGEGPVCRDCLEHLPHCRERAEKHKPTFVDGGLCPGLRRGGEVVHGTGRSSAAGWHMARPLPACWRAGWKRAAWPAGSRRCAGCPATGPPGGREGMTRRKSWPADGGALGAARRPLARKKCAIPRPCTSRTPPSAGPMCWVPLPPPGGAARAIRVVGGRYFHHRRHIFRMRPGAAGTGGQPCVWGRFGPDAPQAGAEQTADLLNAQRRPRKEKRKC